MWVDENETDAAAAALRLKSVEGRFRLAELIPVTAHRGLVLGDLGAERLGSRDEVLVD